MGRGQTRSSTVFSVFSMFLLGWKHSILKTLSIERSKDRIELGKGREFVVLVMLKVYNMFEDNPADICERMISALQFMSLAESSSFVHDSDTLYNVSRNISD